jgi:hypothetical protein
MPTALVLIGGLVLVIILIFAGFHWLKPEHLKLKLKWNCLELELKRASEQKRVPAKRPTKRLPKHR